MRPKLIALLFTIYCWQACTENKTSPTGGIAAEDALKTFQLPRGFKIELVASEPMISSPVAMDVDESGNIYVVEMHGYPLDTSGTGIIRLLTDTSADGVPDKSSVFADHLVLPTGIMKWKKGILVVDVPDILYFEDANKDGKADIKKVLITGLARTNPQHIANTPIYGLDNWIYVAHMGTVTPKVPIDMEFNDTGSNVRYPDLPDAKQLPRNANGRNIRFNPDKHQLEMLSGESQYGQTFDDWGHHLGTSNAHHLFHEAIAAKYLQRNPDLLVSDADNYIPDHGNAAEVYPITVNPLHQLLTDVGVITSSCGVTWYQGGLFPDSFANITFIAEPVHNLVHADRITDKGASFSASRVYQKKEFLASTDPWFRPVQFYIGPDGALYVIDYYRQIIEHPEWMSDEVNNSDALYNGADKGRIYRITPTSTEKINWCGKLKLADVSTAELIKALSSSNIWWRRTAQRLLINRKDPKTVSLLHQLLDTTHTATATLHALWTLEGFNKMDASTIQKALHHPVAGVRENAIQIAEQHLKDFPGLESDLLALQNDHDAKVRYQLLCTLGDLKDASAEAAQQKILMNDIEDKWVQIAALSSLTGKELSLLEKSISVLSSNPSGGKKTFFENCSAVIGLSQRADDIKKVIELATSNSTGTTDWWQSACLRGLSDAFSIKKDPPLDLSNEKKILLSKFLASTPPLIRKTSIDLISLFPLQKNEAWKAVLKNARIVAANRNENVSYRDDALHLIALEKNANDSTLLEKLITPDEQETLQATALITYNELSSQNTTTCIIRNWKNLTHGVRDVAMDVFLSSSANMNVLLNAVQNGTIQSATISWPRMVELMNNDDENIRKRARKLLAGSAENRDEVYKKYEPALTIKSDPKNGIAVFQRVCAACHQVAGQYGKQLGPDLGTVRNHSASSIMGDILNPNRSIADNYEMWTIIKKNGEKLEGIMVSETSTSIATRSLGGSETVVSRSDIKTMEASETSAMPIGLESSISVKEMADLLAFLKNIH